MERGVKMMGKRMKREMEEFMRERRKDLKNREKRI